MDKRTTVGIVGAGPAGLVLGNALQRAGIDCVIVERRSRDYIEARARAGLLEHCTVNTLAALGLADGLTARAARHASCEFRYGGRRFSLPYSELAGDQVHYVYPQQFLVADLVAAFLAGGGDLRFEDPVVDVREVDGQRPRLRLASGVEVVCGFVAGADGIYGATRAALPADSVRQRVRCYPYRWLAVLAEVPPSTTEIIYALHPDGFAGHMLRTPTVSRFYLQCAPGESVDDWPAERVWEQLHRRLAVDDDWQLAEGPVIDANVLEMHTSVCEPMRHGRVFLLGDAAHVVTPAGAKGMNLAIGDADELAAGIAAKVHGRDQDLLDRYSRTRLHRVWQAQQFSDWMLHLINSAPPGPDQDFEHGVRVARLEALRTEPAAAAWFAANYVGGDGRHAAATSADDGGVRSVAAHPQ